ncbi:MAG TPA: nicotinate-nucleotide adenylyltransferase, partial [Planococcus sp. (in: firmicutes)]|nr:nicotinate-nucleotide adenylyltransferase [Planococcus sp. (in: firmicutes)]
MARLAIDGHAGFRVEGFEIQQGGVSYTYDTMLKLMDLEPDSEFYFIIGGDSITDLSSWHRIDELAGLVRFIGISRPGFENTTPYSVRMIDSPEMHLSSTMLRDRVAQGRTISFLVPEKVEAFIRKERLYGPECNVAEGEKTPT